MSEAAKKLLAVLLELPLAERTAMRDALTESLSEGDGHENLTRAEWKDAWAAEVERRIAASEASGDPGIPHEEVMRRMTEKFDAELDRRLAEHESGNEKGIPADEFFRELRARGTL